MASTRVYASKLIYQREALLHNEVFNSTEMEATLL